FERWAIDPIALMTDYLHEYVPCATGKTDGLGNPWTYQYDSHGYLTETITPDAIGTIYTYDDATLMVSSVTDGNSSNTRSDYEGLANRTMITDALGQVTTMTYDPVFNRVTSITEPTGRMFTFMYDGTGNLIRRTDPLNNVWNYTYVVGTDLVDIETDPR